MIKYELSVSHEFNFYKTFNRDSHHYLEYYQDLSKQLLEGESFVSPICWFQNDIDLEVENHICGPDCSLQESLPYQSFHHTKLMCTKYLDIFGEGYISQYIEDIFKE